MFCQKHSNGIANSEDPDQTAPLGAVCSGSALFAQTYRKLRVITVPVFFSTVQIDVSLVAELDKMGTSSWLS